MTRCGNCGTEWAGLTECHCPTCCAHFGSIDAFDRHRQGPVDTRHCADPATLLRKDGKPVFRAVDRSRPATERRAATVRSAVTWVVDRGPGSRFPLAHPESDSPDGASPGPGTPGTAETCSAPAPDRQEAPWRALDAPSEFPATAVRLSRCPDVEVVAPGEPW